MQTGFPGSCSQQTLRTEARNPRCLCLWDLMDAYGLAKSGSPVCLYVPLSRCLLCVSLRFSPHPHLPLYVCPSECVSMGVCGSGCGLLLGSLVSFLLFICSRVFVCFCPCPVCLCWSVSPAVLSLKLLPLTCLFPSLSVLCEGDFGLCLYTMFIPFSYLPALTETDHQL